MKNDGSTIEIRKKYFWFFLVILLLIYIIYPRHNDAGLNENNNVKDKIVELNEIDNVDYMVEQNDTSEQGSLIQLEEIQLKDTFSKVNRLHWTHMPLIYKFEEPICNSYRAQKIREAFEEINSETNGSVSFIESENPDIIIYCSVTVKDEQKLQGDYWVETLGEGGISAYYGNRVINATIIFYPTTTSCGYFPSVEIHEILHTFNYPHNNRPCSIMYSGEENCRYILENQDICGKPHIDDDIVKSLIETYSIKYS